jgi:signal transduction histidine kinase/CheY-like chemotaxis protein
MQKLRFLSPIQYATIICIFAVAAAAAVIVNRTTQEANRVFASVVLLAQINNSLLKSVNTTITYMDERTPARKELAGEVQNYLTIFDNRWSELRGILSNIDREFSEVLLGEANISEDFDRFLALGYSLVRDKSTTSQSPAYQEFLSLGGQQLQETIALAQSLAQNDYARINKQMERQLNLALVAILVLLLAGAAFSRRTLLAMDEAREAAESADRAKSEFLATMSHEIRTPMTGVLGIAELLARSELTEKQRTFVSAIIKSGEALTAIINDVLDLSKIEAGKMKVRPHPFDLIMTVEDIATLLSPRAAEKGIELAVRVQPDLPSSFIGDAGHIRQVVINLIGNAIKFTDQGHVLLDISGSTKDGHASLTFTVEDTGVGIPDDKRQQLFDQFSQIDNPATRREQGTGLGLAISSKLVALMGGKIGVASEEGKGSRFWFSLDLPIDPTAPARHLPPHDVSGVSVLVIDDNEINRMVIVEQLRSWNFEAYSVDSGEKGLQALREASKAGAPFDMAVIDYHMPKMDGLDLAAAIRHDSLVEDVPILMLTSVMASDDEARFRQTRINGHLTKPARASLLLDTVMNILYGERPPAATAESTSADAA